MKFFRAAEMTLRDLAGRRAPLVLILVVPLVFYAARRSDAGWQGMRMACMGLAWATSTIALFATQAARPLEQRLRQAGLGVADLVGGRAVALGGAASVVGGAYGVVVVLDQGPGKPWVVAIAVVMSALLAVPLGLLVGTLVPRELEGMMVLIMIVGTQTIVDQEQAFAAILPLWSTRELLGYAVDGVGDTGVAYLHAACFGFAMLVAALAITAFRLRRRRHAQFEPAISGGALSRHER